MLSNILLVIYNLKIKRMFVIYALKYCPYSERAVRIAQQLKLKAKVIWITHEDKNKYKKLNNMNTFPQIFYYSTLNAKTPVKIGGCDDFEKLIKTCQQVNSINLKDKALCDICNQLK